MIEYIDKHKGDNKPFFGFLSYTAPHSPLQAPDDYIAKYADRYQAGWDELRKERLARQKALRLVPQDMELPPLRGNDPAFVPWANVPAAQQAIDAKKMAVYAAMIDFMDMSIGRLVQHLKDIGEYENTLIIFMSDNGPEANNLSAQFEPLIKNAGIPLDNSLDNIGRFSSYVSPAPGFALASDLPSFGAKSSVTEGGVRNNFILSYPAVIKGKRRTGAFATVLDVVPTLLSYAQVQYPASFNGQTLHPLNGSSMRQLLEGTSAKVHSADEPIGYEVFGTVNKALYQGRWKLECVGDAPWGAGRAETWKLFDLRTDRNQANDLSLVYPERLNRMVELYQQYQTRVGYVSATTGVNNCGIRTAAGFQFEHPLTLQDLRIRRLTTAQSLVEMLGRPLTLRDVFSDDF
jgi:arylsulfatase